MAGGLSNVIAWRKKRLQKTVDRLYALRREIEPGFVHHDEAFQEFLCQKRPGRWLDVGCGQNPFVREYGANFSFAAGCDMEPSLVPCAHRPFVLADALSLPFAPASFDLVTLYFAAEHFDRVGDALRELNRVLRPGGLFLCLTSDRKYWASRLNRLMPENLKRALLGLFAGQKEQDIFKAHYRFNDADQVPRLLEQTGFTEIQVRRFREYYNFSGFFFRLQHLLNNRTPLGRTELFFSSMLACARKA